MPIPGVTVEDVDAYSDVSNGSTISVGSAASGGSAHMPRPPTGGSRRPKSAQGRQSRVAKSPYSSSQLKSSTKQQPPKPAARNMWITAMRNGTSTLSSEYSPMKTLSGSRAASLSKQNRSATRTRHLSDYVQVDNLKNKSHVRSASMSASEPHLSGGGPAYKPQEDYYDEIIELKKIINALKAENNAINTKLRRVEGENVLKDRKMEDLLNTRKQPEDVRRTLTDKKGDTSAIVNSLKQKLHAVERTVKDKEAELSQLKNDMKMSNIEELQIQSETYYQEVQRLQLALIEMQQSQVHDSFGRTSPRDNTIPKGMKAKPASVSLQRLAEENDHLKAENRSLKKDLLTAIENASGNKNVPLKADYADMNRGQLLAKIHELEEKVQESGGKGSLTRKGSIPEDKERDVEVKRKSVSKLNSQVPGRIELRGTTSQKLAQLQEREIELLEEREKQREIIERLKEDRAHYRSVADDLRLQLKSTQEELDRLRDEKGVAGERRRSSASLTSPTRKPSVKEVPLHDDQDEDLDRMLNEFQQQRAAKALQRQWRGYQGRKKQHMEEEERQTHDRQNQAASTLQKNWRRHRDRTKQKEEDDKEQAVSEIQSALRGHAVRNKYIEQLDKELEFTDRDDAVVAIQSAMRAHAARQKHLGSPEEELQSRDTRTRGSSSRSLHDSEPDSDEGLVTKASVSKRHPEPARPDLRRSSFTGTRRSLITAPRFSNISEERSEEEEAQVTSPSRSRSLQKRSGGLLESVPKETEQRPKKKPFEIVDSDDDDDDDAMVSRPRRSLDTGMSQQRPSLSRSSRGLGPPSASSPREESRVSTVEGGRPGLSRSTGRVLGDSESSRDENLQRPGLSRSKRPLSGQRPGLNRSGSGADKETDSRASSSRKSSLPAGSEEDSEDDVIVTGKKTTTVSDKKTTGRPSLTRRSPAKTVPASSQRDSITSSLDTFFSSTVPSKESSSKKSPRKTAATFNDSDDDDDDDDDDEDEIVSSLSRFKSKQKGKASTDSVAGLWATSDKGSDTKNRRKSSTKWSPDFEFERPPSRSRPDSALDELF